MVIDLIDVRDGDEDGEAPLAETVPLAEALRRVLDYRPGMVVGFEAVTTWLMVARACGLRRPETDDEDEAQAGEMSAALRELAAAGDVLQNGESWRLLPAPRARVEPKEAP